MSEARTEFPFVKLLEVWVGVISILVAGGSFLAVYLSLEHHTSKALAVAAGAAAALAAATPYLVVAALVNLGRQIADSTRRLERSEPRQPPAPTV